MIAPIVAEFDKASRDRLTRILALTPERDASVAGVVPTDALALGDRALQSLEQLRRARPGTATLQIDRAHRHARSVPATALGHAVSDIPDWAQLVRRADAHGKHRSEALRHAASARTALHRAKRHSASVMPDCPWQAEGAARGPRGPRGAARSQSLDV